MHAQDLNDWIFDGRLDDIMDEQFRQVVAEGCVCGKEFNHDGACAPILIRSERNEINGGRS